MSLFSWPPRAEIIFWVVTGYLSAWAVYKAKQTLEEVREVTRITKEDKPADLFGQHTEDGRFQSHTYIDTIAETS